MTLQDMRELWNSCSTHWTDPPADCAKVNRHRIVSRELVNAIKKQRTRKRWGFNIARSLSSFYDLILGREAPPPPPFWLGGPFAAQNAVRIANHVDKALAGNLGAYQQEAALQQFDSAWNTLQSVCKPQCSAVEPTPALSNPAPPEADIP